MRSPQFRRWGAHRALRSVPGQTAWPAAIVDEHGYDLYVLANVLTADPAHAERLVAQAISAHGDGPCAFRELAGAVYLAWFAWGSVAGVGENDLGEQGLDEQGRDEQGRAPVGSKVAQVMRELHALPEDQRAAIGLCRYGGHTYRQAAEALGLPAADTAQLLGQALRALAPPGAGRVQPAPTASEA